MRIQIENTQETYIEKNESIRSTFGKIPSIEAIRGIAVILVVLLHYYVLRAWLTESDPFIEAVNLFSPVKSFIVKGHIGVEIFFMITGFLLILPWLKNDSKTSPSIKDYFVRRILRIVPAYYFHLFLLFFIIFPLFSSTQHLFSHYWLTNFSAHLGFIHNFDPNIRNSLMLNGALWTLSLEMQYYLILPLIAMATVRTGIIVPITLIIIAFAWRYSVTESFDYFFKNLSISHPPNVQNYIEDSWRKFYAIQLPGYLGNFGCGILVAICYIKNYRLPISNNIASMACIAFFSSLFIVEQFHEKLGNIEFSWNQYQVLLSIILGIALYLIVLYPKSIAYKLINNRILIFSGKISYSVYLMHIPLILIFNKIFPYEQLIFPTFIGTLYILSFLSFTFIEKKFAKNLR